MPKLYTASMKALLCFIVSFVTLATVFAQTTVNTPIPSGLVYVSDTEPGVVIFGVKNNNTGPITITNISCWIDSGYGGEYKLWYNPTTVTGAPSAISTANGWTQLTPTGTVPVTTSYAVVEVISGLSLIIPAGAVYRLALQAPIHQPYYGTSGSTGTIASNGGVDIYLQNNAASPCYAGTFPGPATFTPRSFFGNITYVPTNTCTGPPTAGSAITSAGTVCNGTAVTLDLTGHTIGTGQTYQWQSSATQNGTYTNIGTASSSPIYTFTPSSSMWYHAIVSCSGQDMTSNPVEVKVNNLLAGGNYTIDGTQITGGTNFQTFTDAINALSCGATGAVTFKVSAGQVFTEDVPQITGSGTAVNTITFQKEGAGANPKIIPLSPGTVASTTTLGNHGDGIIVINGGDYITFDGIDLETNGGFTGTGLYEFGYYLKKASATNACKNVTIKNCTVTLSKAAIYSFGIFVSNISGTATVTVTSTGGRSENIKLFNNVITNSYGGIHVRGYAASTPFDLYDQNIEIGVDGMNDITNYGGGGSAAYGIYAISQNNLKIANNHITSGTGSTSTLYGILTSTGTNSNVDIYNNTITVTGGATASTVAGISNGMGGTGTSNQVNIYNNTITNCTYPTATSGPMTMIEQTASAFKSAIYGNSITNNNHTPTTTGAFNCIIQSGSVVNETKIYNNTITGNTKSTGTTGAMNCISHTSATTATTEIYGNTISGNISQGAILFSIAQTGGGISNIYKNNIFNQTSNAALGSTYGVSVTGGTTNNVYNNFISELYAPAASATAEAIRGINVNYTTATTNINLSYNSIFLNASSSGTNFGTAGIYHTTSTTATTASLTLKNNNVVNNSTPNGTGKTSAYRRSSTTLTNFNSASNNNNYYAGSPSVNNVLFYDGTNGDQTIAAYKARVTPIDNNSLSEDAPFVNVSTSPYDLHLNPAIPTQLEGAGSPIATITTDFDGDTRNAGTPDIGADEFAGTPIDLTPPNIVYTPLPGDCNQGNRTLSGVVITDASGVPTTGGLMPRIYYSKNGGTWFSQPGTLTSGSATNGTWSFTIIAADMGGVALGNIISYYIIAQDLSPASNLTSNPPGVSATSVNNVSTPPATPNIYYVGGALSGNYDVGATGTFTTLTQAVNTYNASTCLAGPVTFLLADNVYAGTETFPIVINANASASATNTLTIRPKAATPVTITGTTGTALAAIIKLNGADYVTIDGVNTGGASLSVENTSTTAGSAVIWLSSVAAGDGATNNRIKNLSLRAGVEQHTATTVTYGIVIAGNALNTAITTINAGDDNDNNLIEGNTIVKARYGIYTRGGATTNPNTGTIIRNNIIGPTNFGAEEIGKGGIVVREEDGVIIKGNEIRYVGGDFANTSGGTDRVGITLGTDASWTATSVFVKNAVITNNSIHDVVEERTFSAVGIATTTADGTNPTNNLIANNMIYNLLANGTSTDQTVGIGTSGGRNDKIVFNSIYLSGDTDPGASTTPTQSNYGIRITSTSVVNLLVKNNIVHMDLSSSSAAATVKNACIDLPASFVWGTGGMNNNDWYIIPSNTRSNIGSIGNTAGTFYNTLAAWKTATSQDAQSLDIDPAFVAPNNLHLNGFSQLDDKGTPVAGVTDDFDGETRDAGSPDIGADELGLSSGLDFKASLLVSPALTQGCYNTESITIRIKNNSVNAIDFSVNNVTVNVAVTGAATTNLSTTLTTGTLASSAYLDVTMPATLNMNTAGTYTFDASTSLTGDINPGNNSMATTSRTKVVLDAGIAGTSSADYCISGTPTLSLSGAQGYSGLQWQMSATSGSGFTNISGGTTNPYTVTAPITQTTYYKAIVTCGAFNIESTEALITVNNPAITGTIPGSRCGAGQVTLQATGSSGTTVNWYANATGGAPLATGNSYQPNIVANTNYYAAASAGKQTYNVGVVNTNAGNPFVTMTAGWGLMFTVNVECTIDSVAIFPVTAAGGTITPNISTTANTVIFTAPQSVVPPNTGTTKQMIPIGVTLQPGQYKMCISQHALTNLNNESFGFAGFPLNSFPVNITSSTQGAGAVTSTYYFFYDWRVSIGCEGSRVPVAATIDNCVPYVFNGNGNWSNPANWLNGLVPPSPLPAGYEIQVNPSDNDCVLDVPYVVGPGGKLTVKAGRSFIVQGNLTLQ